MKRTLINALSESGDYIIYVCAVLFVLYSVSGIYIVDQNEIGVHQRFGAVIQSKVPPGIHFAFPYPIDTVRLVPVTITKTLQVNDFFPTEESRKNSLSFSSRTGLNPYVLTGDNNIVNIRFNVKYTVRDPVDYLFEIPDNRKVLHYISANAMIHSLARIPVRRVLGADELGPGARKIRRFMKQRISRELQSIDAGLQVSFVEISPPEVPDPVKRFFEDVVEARNDRERIKSEAKSYRNRILLEAESTANELTQNAEAYAEKEIAEAKGDSKRFLKTLASLKEREHVTRKRLYIDFVRDVFPTLKNVYVLSGSDERRPATLKIFPD